jgi:large subunit ribosomal protein L30
MTRVRVTQTRSAIGHTRAHEGTLRALGLGKIGRSAEHEQTRVLEGQLRHVAHLVTVTPLDGERGKDS